MDLRLVLVGRDLHRRMLRDPGALPEDPARPLPGLAVRNPSQMPAEPAGNLGEGRPGIRIRQAADKMSAGEGHKYTLEK